MLIFSIFLSSDLTRLSVWVLDGDPGNTNYLKYALTEKNFPHTLVILTVSMTAPWSWQKQLEHWTKIVKERLEQINISPGDVNFQQNKTNYVHIF